MKYIYRYTPGIILLVYLFLFLGLRSPERSWDRIINSDGKGYYAYLPAIFIYHDLQFRFVENYEAQYYPANRAVFKEFRNEANGKVVNKYFPGMAILWLPFFLFGHLMAWLEIFPRDGYSLPYQYAIALSAFMFLWLGARWLRKLLLELGSNDKTASFLTIVIALGTNLLFFVVIEPSMTHVYSFALITGFALFTQRLFHDYKPKWFVKSLLLFTLIFLIRPTNGLVIMLVPFLAGSKETMVRVFRTVVANKPLLVRGLVQASILVAIPLVLWFIQTGKPLVYTYAGEKLNFLRPEIFNILFSFNRGWFLYTPAAFISLFGFVGLYRQDRYKFWWLASFLIVFIYVVSCWWVWYYASKFGQRVFIDIYAVIAVLLLYLYAILRSGLLKKLLSSLLILLIMTNCLQFYQHAKWIFPPYNINKEIYLSSALSLRQKAVVFIPADGLIHKTTFENDMEADKGIDWMNPRTLTDSVSYQGRWSSKTDKKIPYSVGLEKKIESLFVTANRIVLVKALVFSPKETTEATLVVDYQLDGRSLSYNQFILEKFVPVDKWTPLEVAWYVPRDFPANGTLKVYFYNPSPLYKLFVDNLNIDLLSMKDDPDYQKIEGVIWPEAMK